MRLTAHDREGRERLFRYGARPPFALERFSELGDGRIAYRLKTPNRRGDTHRVMTPVECLARLCALVPPPWQPLVRFHGVLAPNHAWRSLVVPRRTAPPANTTACPRPLQRSLFPRPPSALREPDDVSPRPVSPSPPAPRPPRATNASHLDWATLLARTFALDALECPRCLGRLRLLAVVTAPTSVAALLDAPGRA
ncbi:MAG: transposase, partial [Polyangiaceae bacterium]|nr:transposase [Polyangiaceae bacterium]